MKKSLCLVLILFSALSATFSQGALQWSADGNTYYTTEDDGLVAYRLPSQERSVLVPQNELVPAGETTALPVRSFRLSADNNYVLIYTNTVKVWRQDTRGDYWVLDREKHRLRQLGKTFPASSLMFAKFSPDASQVAYVSGYNLYVEDVATGNIKALTTDGTRRHINGTFDWAYEEEFFCRDGFRWNAAGTHIAFWQVDAEKIPDFYMINNTDSVYAEVIPVEYPTAGQDPSPARIGVANVASGAITWMKLPGDPQQHYVPVMDWSSPGELMIQQLNRKQNESKLFVCHAATGAATLLYTETDDAWIDIYDHAFTWINGGKEFLWLSEKDGWRHLYAISRKGTERLLTKGDYDVIQLDGLDEKSGTVYFTASPENATQRYLYTVKLNGKAQAKRVSPAGQQGTHGYALSPSGKYAQHNFSSVRTRPMTEWIALPAHKPLDRDRCINEATLKAAQTDSNVEFFTITAGGVEMDGWMVKPENFDPAKKYPVVFYVYTEPAGTTVRDRYHAAHNRLYRGNMARDGYLYISVDNRGTPAPKGRAWRKCIYRKIGRINIDDQAAAAKEILKWDFADPGRVAVWGWSGGGSATLNLLFRYPDIYKTGIAVAAVANQLTYDNIYQERYMGLPQENREDFVAGSPIAYAKNLQGNLLYIHGTGDDNVHYNNAEMLINELIRYNKQFRFMAYPNRTHSISEGEGTFEHLSTLYTNYLKQHCPPGGR